MTQNKKKDVFVSYSDKNVKLESGDYSLSPYCEKFITSYSQGDQVEITYNEITREITFIKKISASTVAKIENIDEKEKKGYVKLNGKWYATFKSLLDSAHNIYKNGFSINTELLERDSENYFALFKATFSYQDDEGNVHVFTAYGDADKENMSLNIRSSYIRMAETRAIVRCLRFATNIAETSIEEIHEVKEE